MAKIVFITSRFPYPLNKGDKLRVYFQLKQLSTENDVHLIALNDREVKTEEMNALAPYCKSTYVFVLPFYKRIFQLIRSVFNKLPLQVAFFYNPRIKKQIEQLVQDINPDFVHCHLIRTTEYVKDITEIQKSLDFMDAFAKGMEKRQLIEPNLLKRLLFNYEKKQLYRYEAEVFDFVDKFCIISNQDKNAIQSPRSKEIHCIPNGVDFETFHPKPQAKKYDLLFMGNLGYPPNIAAIDFLLREIFPLVVQQKPDVKLLIAGINASNRLRKTQSVNIDVVEHFEDISDSIALSKVMLAPMTISIGLQNKILQAMAMKTPCIVSPMCNNAIQAPTNIAIVEANSPDEFANAIMELLTNEQKAMEIGQEGYKFVKEHYSWERQHDLFTQLILQHN